MEPSLTGGRGPTTSAGLLRVLLVLGRVSNLPTVWSNCAAAWLIAGGARWDVLIVVCAGTSLLYTAGMFLNDAFDVEFDRRFRPERPIVSGRIRRRTVWITGSAMLAAGANTLWMLGAWPGLFGLALAVLIVVYNAVHKGTSLAPLLMAGCRFLVYPIAASTVSDRIAGNVLAGAGALALYILGLSLLARVESTTAVARRWPCGLLFAPIPIALVCGGGAIAIVVPALIQGGWVLRCLLARSGSRFRFLSTGVSGLLAGIVLVDWLAVGTLSPPWCAVFAAFLLSALALQRFAPAT